LKLTTPEIRDYDSVFPGENWFFYWKTSPSLWEAKLSEYTGALPLFVPIYWGFHSEHEDQYDFGTYKPETDLKRLLETAQRVGKEIVLMLPVSPSPFLPNGGIPSYLARTMAISEDGLALTVLDNESRMNKVYSYYDPRIFQAFRKFNWYLGQYLSQTGISCEVFGAEFGYLKNGNFISFIEDHSIAFEQGFNRYIKQLQETDPEEVQLLLDNPSYEVTFKKRFSHLIADLYQQAAQESVAGNWGRVIQFALLGGAPDDIFPRSSDLWEHEGNFFKPLLEILVNNITPCSVLLSPYLRRGTLIKSLNDLVTNSFVRSQMNNALYENDERVSFLPLVFFEIYTPDQDALRENNIVEKVGLTNFFKRDFQWTYRMQHHLGVTTDNDEIHKVHFLFGQFMTKDVFTTMLKLFMNGGRIFMDVANLDEDLKQKLNLFITENNIETESINYLTNIVKAQLGEGVLLLYDSEKLIENSLMRKIGFWETMIKYLNLKHLRVQNDEELYYLWKSRCSNTYELDYEEIRRVSFYNPTSYKKKAQVLTTNNFAFLKTIDQIHGNVKSTPVGIDIELLPGGSVSLDFGFYE
jgi:hypothetical protein